MKGFGRGLCLVLGLAQGAAAQGRPLGFSEAGWVLSGPGVRVVEVDGREALALGNGSAARVDLPVEDGVFEFDLRMPTVRSFVGFRFRMDAAGNAEEIYFRPHKGGQPDALQYAPVFAGESYWQVFHGPSSTAAVDFPSAPAWLHVRLVVEGRRAAVFLGGEAKPVLVSALAREARAGFFALYASYAVAPGGAGPAATVSGLVVKPVEAADALPDPPAGASAAAGSVRDWDLSGVFPWSGGLPLEWPAGVVAGPWTAAASDASGILLVGRYRQRRPGAGSSGVLARVRVRSARAQTKRLELGFSDAAALFVNGVPVYAGDHAFSQNFPRRQGLVTPSQATVFVPLREGENEIVVAVVDAMGGWALSAAFADPEGLTLERPGR